HALLQAQRALLMPDGLPNRPWFHHAIYAPGQYTGYAAVVIPGVNEAIDRHDVDRTREQISALAAALNRATKVLERYHSGIGVPPCKAEACHCAKIFMCVRTPGSVRFASDSSSL